MKKVVYITAFTVLGLLVATLVHAGVELPILHFIFTDYESYGDTFLLRHWDLVHGMGGALLWIIGVAIGFFFGHHYWHAIYGGKTRNETDGDSALKNPHAALK